MSLSATQEEEFGLALEVVSSPASKLLVAGLGGRSIFAERWERLVYNMLYHSKRDDHGGRAVSTVSFRTEDYLPGEAIGHPDS